MCKVNPLKLSLYNINTASFSHSISNPTLHNMSRVLEDKFCSLLLLSKEWNKFENNPKYFATFLYEFIINLNLNANDDQEGPINFQALLFPWFYKSFHILSPQNLETATNVAKNITKSITKKTTQNEEKIEHKLTILSIPEEVLSYCLSFLDKNEIFECQQYHVNLH